MFRAQRIAAVLSFLLVVASGTVPAASLPDPTSQGFLVPLPEIEPADLVSELRQTRAELEARRLHYHEAAEYNRMTIGKFIFALIAPGGLLMAAGAELMHTQAEKKVASLDVEIRSLGVDLEIFEGIERDRRLNLARHP